MAREVKIKMDPRLPDMGESAGEWVKKLFKKHLKEINRMVQRSPSGKVTIAFPVKLDFSDIAATCQVRCSFNDPTKDSISGQFDSPNQGQLIDRSGKVLVAGAKPDEKGKPEAAKGAPAAPPPASAPATPPDDKKPRKAGRPKKAKAE